MIIMMASVDRDRDRASVQVFQAEGLRRGASPSPGPPAAPRGRASGPRPGWRPRPNRTRCRRRRGWRLAGRRLGRDSSSSILEFIISDLSRGSKAACTGGNGRFDISRRRSEPLAPSPARPAAPGPAGAATRDVPYYGGKCPKCRFSFITCDDSQKKKGIKMYASGGNYVYSRRQRKHSCFHRRRTFKQQR